MSRVLCAVLVLLVCVGCGATHLEDFQREGEARAKKILALLKSVHSKEEMQAASGKLRSHTEKLTATMIQAKKFQLKRSEGNDRPILSIELSDALRVEMERLAHIPGVEQIIHDMQRDSLHKLDAFDRQMGRVKIRSNFSTPHHPK